MKYTGKIRILKQPTIYMIVGLANTVVTVFLIFTLMAYKVNALIANAIGYTAGLMLSFFLNSFLTFKIQIHRLALIRFVAAAAIAYVANFFIVVFVIRFAGEEKVAQLVGMLVYAVVGYLLNKYWAMKEKK
jgi:putative flippase GtrA